MIALLASLRPRATDWIFSLKTFAAAMTALFIALSCGLEKPFWAMATVYIVLLAHVRRAVVQGGLPGAGHHHRRHRDGGAGAQSGERPRTAQPRARAVGRRVPCRLAARPYPAVLRHHARGLYGGAHRLSGGERSRAVFDTAVARVEEIVLGITCAGLFGHLLLPRHVGPMVAGRIDAWLKDAGELTLDAFAGVTGAEARAKRARLAADATELHGSRCTLPMTIPSFAAPPA